MPLRWFVFQKYFGGFGVCILPSSPKRIFLRFFSTPSIHPKNAEFLLVLLFPKLFWWFWGSYHPYTSPIFLRFFSSPSIAIHPSPVDQSQLFFFCQLPTVEESSHGKHFIQAGPFGTALLCLPIAAVYAFAAWAELVLGAGKACSFAVAIFSNSGATSSNTAVLLACSHCKLFGIAFGITGIAFFGNGGTETGPAGLYTGAADFGGGPPAPAFLAVAFSDAFAGGAAAVFGPAAFPAAFASASLFNRSMISFRSFSLCWCASLCS